MGRETIHGEDGPVKPNAGVPVGKPWVGVDEYSVGQFYPSPDGSGKPIAVQMNMEGTFVIGGDAHQATVLLRLKSAQAVDELCRALLRSRRGVWPNEPVNVY